MSVSTCFLTNRFVSLASVNCRRNVRSAALSFSRRLTSPRRTTTSSHSPSSRSPPGCPPPSASDAGSLCPSLQRARRWGHWASAVGRVTRGFVRGVICSCTKLCMRAPRVRWPRKEGVSLVNRGAEEAGALGFGCGACHARFCAGCDMPMHEALHACPSCQMAEKRGGVTSK